MMLGNKRSTLSSCSSALPPEPSLEELLFLATHSSDVNAVKSFCDGVRDAIDGAATACVLLAHRMQSPQEQEALQALVVLEACFQACGEEFAKEVNKFKFLNEMVKLVSPKYLANRTSQKVKLKVIELLFKWSRSSGQSKIREAYEMLKKQGIVKTDPRIDEFGDNHYEDGIGRDARPSPLGELEARELKRLLQSRHPEDLKEANNIIQKMVRAEESRMERLTDLAIGVNNARLLEEMLEHAVNGDAESELMAELYESCDKMRSRISAIAAKTSDKDINEVLEASDQLTRAMERYKSHCQTMSKHVAPNSATDTLVTLDDHLAQSLNDVVIDGGSSDQQLLNLGENLHEHKEMISLNDVPNEKFGDNEDKFGDKEADLVTNNDLNENLVSVDALLESATASTTFDMESEESAPRKTGLEELDLLGESAILSQLSSRSPQFAKKSDNKRSMNELAEQQRKANIDNLAKDSFKAATKSATDISTKSAIDLSTLSVSLSSIRPDSRPPLNIAANEDVMLQLHFGKDPVAPNVSAIVVTIMNKGSSAIGDLELRLLAPSGVRLLLQPFSGKSLAPSSPFLPPSAITAVLLVDADKGSSFGLKYIVTYFCQGQPHSLMGDINDISL